jgi:beta-xylosidase
MSGRAIRRSTGCRILAVALAVGALIGAVAHASRQAGGQSGSANAAPRSGLRLPDMPLHDPWILAHRASRTYYLYTSNSARMTGISRTGTMVYKSKDLAIWDGPYNVFQVPDGFWASQGGWAPEVHEHKGRFYLFTTVHDSAKVIAAPPQVVEKTYARGTIIAASDSPGGPFVPVKNGPIAPEDLMTLDGTLYVDPSGAPWMVFAHEWIQTRNGTMEAVRLKPDLSSAMPGPPRVLFKASEAPWCDPAKPQDTYVTDGPELFRTRDGHLLMLWSSWENGSYVQTVARSKSGALEGPWEQLPPLVKEDSGHGMLFHTFGGQLMMVLHRPFRNARGKLYDMEDLGDHLRIVRERTDLDGPSR